MTDSILWYATRGAGIVSLILLTVVFCLGIVTALRWQNPAWPRFLSAELHRSLALLSVVFLGVHVITAIVDPYVDLGWATAIIPFTASYRQLWLGLGVVAVDLGLAVVVTSLVRARLGHAIWRAVHWTAYACWPLALLHGIGTGSDTSALWMRAVYGASLIAVVAATAWRIATNRTETQRPLGVSVTRELR